jgi:aldose 1-epimerase
MKNFLRFSFLFASLLLMNTATRAEITTSNFSSIKLYTLKNRHGMTVKVTNYGAIITSIIVPDKNGKMADVALGYDHLESYINAVDRPYFGAVVGRYGNRIAEGKFTLDGQTYELAINNKPNSLHGGNIGFDKVVWDVKLDPTNNAIALHYLAKDKEEGYPGNLDLTVTYKLTDDNKLEVTYDASTDKATPINVTQHSYFNLKGEGQGNILDHEVMINADQFTPVDQNLIPTGQLANVEGTPLDFRKPKVIGKDIDADNEQIKIGGGFDHNWVLNKPSQSGQTRLAAEVYEPSSGRVLTVSTTEPGVQFYCGNFLDGRLKGKSGGTYVKRGGFCLETQHFPDSPNQPNFPNSILKPGEKLHSVTTFAFSVR